MGRDHTYIIAEVGSNWAANLDAAYALIDAAKDAGADAVKFQAGHADHVYDPAQFPEEHASFKKWVEPTLDVLPQLAKRCEERGVDFGCSAFCFDALDAVDPFVKWHKIASIEATWKKFTDAVLAKSKPVVWSFGMTTVEEMLALPKIVDRVVYMTCTVAYPAELADADLQAMKTWSEPWGLSDHTTHPTIAPRTAVALGASVIEKHIRPTTPCWECEMYGSASKQLHGDLTATPDFPHSLNPAQFKEMVQAIRLTEQALGSSEKRIRESERPYLKFRRGPRGLRGA